MSKIRKLVAVLQVWKEYTVVLGLTSAQILKKIYEKDQEKKIASYELKVMGKLKKQAATSFVGSAEEDTEDK